MGYFKVTDDGHIGPLLVTQPIFMAEAIDLALLATQERIKRPNQRLLVPGDNSTAIQRLLNYGYHFDGIELLLSSHPLPHLSQVIFHDTDLL